MYKSFQAAIYNGVGIALIRKAASTSIKRSIEQVVKVCPMSDKGTQPEVPVYAFIRDPRERFYSAMRYLPGKHHTYPVERTYHEQVDAVLHGIDDDHWLPQSTILEGINDLTCFPFYMLPMVWSELFQAENGFPDLLYLNRSDPFSRQRIRHTIDHGYRKKELREFYSQDYKLWGKMVEHNG